MVRKITLAKKKKIYSLSKSGIPIANLAERFGVSNSCIRQYLAESRRADPQHKKEITND